MINFLASQMLSFQPIITTRFPVNHIFAGTWSETQSRRPEKNLAEHQNSFSRGLHDTHSGVLLRKPVQDLN